MSAPERPAFGYGAYAPPASQRGRPPVILWFRTYAGAVSLFAGATAVAIQWDHARGGGYSAPFLWSMGIAVGLALTHGVGAAVPYKPWGWTYAFLLLLLGLVSCLLPFAVALLLYWKEPTTKAAFRRFL